MLELISAPTRALGEQAPARRDGHEGLREDADEHEIDNKDCPKNVRLRDVTGCTDSAVTGSKLSGAFSAAAAACVSSRWFTASTAGEPSAARPARLPSGGAGRSTTGH